MAAEETLKAVITVEDRTAGALGAIRSRLAAVGALPQHNNQRFKRLGEETGLAKVGEHAKAAGERVKGLHERISGLIPALAGLAATQLGGLQFAGKIAGVSADQINRGVQYFNRQIAEAARGKAKDAQIILTRLGFANTPQHMVKTTAGLDAIAEAAKKLVDSGNIQLASDMMGKLFGSRSGVLLLPMFQQGAAHLHELMARAAHFGLAPSDEDAARGKEFNESLKDLTASVGGFRLAVAGGLFPVLTPVIERMAEWIAANRAWIATDISEAVRRLIDTVENADWRPAIFALRQMGHAADFVMHHLGLVTGILLGLAAWRGLTIVASIVSIGTAAVSALAGVTAAVWALGVAGRVAVAGTGIGLLALAAFEIYENWDTIEPLMEKVFNNLAQSAKVAFGLIGKYGADAVNQIFEKWKEAADWITHHVPAWLSRLWTGGQGGYGIGSSAALPPGGGAPMLPAERAAMARRLYAEARAQGLDRAHALAMLGNASAESGLNPSARGDYQNGIPTSFGLFQWHDSRMRSMLSALGSRGKDPLAQLDYAIARQRARDPGWFGPGSVKDLTNRWETGFERPAHPTDRTPFADRIAQALSKPIGSSTSSTKGAKGQIDLNVRVDHRNPPPGATVSTGARGQGDYEFGGLGEAFAF